ncbi:unnamed protein product [Linum tenue]|uniref:Uncharacterized protein n=1 Tax=Linum tenue TaxID=586396 RepID=A0AAV0KAN9_9ROSI|nr:unnamed protein product [Linum tenue]
MELNHKANHIQTRLRLLQLLGLAEEQQVGDVEVESPRQRESPHLPWIMTRLGLSSSGFRSRPPLLPRLAQKWRVVSSSTWIETGERPRRRK